MEQHLDINLTRADEMRKNVIVNHTCAVIVHAATNNNMRSEYVSPPPYRNGANIDEEGIRLAARKLLNNAQAQDLFMVIKRNLVHSKKVKDAQVSAFAKHVIEKLDPEFEIKNLLRSLELQLKIMDGFIRYIHV
ncbi:hypothetical protein [Enterovibrio norvegicus]|uniref:hypothetical protein n=1 Tax=Enterovibrio norvegicus TaxID=188144 RepID=UPI0024B168DC|nr:hypothetical protein [Enterovibrio norvegicus]